MRGLPLNLLLRRERGFDSKWVADSSKKADSWQEVKVTGKKKTSNAEKQAKAQKISEMVLKNADAVQVRGRGMAAVFSGLSCRDFLLFPSSIRATCRRRRRFVLVLLHALSSSSFALFFSRCPLDAAG